MLIARIYEVFSLLCPICGAQMRIIAFITHIADILQVLVSLGVEAAPPRITPARGPLLSDAFDVQVDDGMQSEPGWAPVWDLAVHPALDDELDQRVNW